MANPKANVIRFDMDEEKKLREKRMKVFNLSKHIRECNNKNLYRTVEALLDPVSVKIFGLTPAKDSDKAVLEVCFPNKKPEELTDEYCNGIVKQTQGQMIIDGYKVIKTSIYRDPNDPEKVIGKILVKMS